MRRPYGLHLAKANKTMECIHEWVAYFNRKRAMSVKGFCQSVKIEIYSYLAWKDTFMTTKGSTLNTAFWLHLLLVIAAWVGPFLFSWYLMVTGYTLIFLQFLVFKKCLVNDLHDLSDDNYYTFYTFLFECVGIHLNQKQQKRLFIFVRRPLYPIMIAFTLFWQLYLGYEPLLF